MLGWIRQQWKTVCDGEMLLILDIHKAQKTDNVKAQFSSINTTTVYIPPGCTSIIQLLDVSVNAPFKAIVPRLANDHCAQNLSTYVQGTIPAGERRVLLTRWVGQAWEEVSANKEMIQQTFHKCGISVPIDRSADSDIHIEGLADYTVRDPEEDGEADLSDDPFMDGEADLSDKPFM